jgi:serine/threonine protein kinase
MVAVKVLGGWADRSGGARRRFEAEAQAISSLNHPNICTLYDVGRQDDIDFLVMEYVEGETLAERLKRGPLPYADVLRVWIEVASALAYAHSRGVVHRDLKPGNIVLTAAGAKLVDFGLARWEQEAEMLNSVQPASVDASLTVTGLILGTPQYMAPEQIERRTVDARTSPPVS